jgi:hypothetical protein
MNHNRLEELRVINNYRMREKVWVEYKRTLLDTFCYPANLKLL